MTSHLNWRWQDQNVQVEVKNGEYVSAESALILAGPSRLSYLSDDGSGTFLGSSNSLIPLGILQNMNITQNQQVQRLFEIGSSRAYFVPGRLFAQFSMSRIMFFGPSLMRLLYSLAPQRLLETLGTPLNIDPDSNQQGIAALPEYEKLFQTGALQNLPGYGGSVGENNRDLYMNLGSELFKVPFGLCIVMKTAQDKPYGAVFMEDCYIESHQFGIDSGNIIMAESVSGQFGRLAPIQLAAQSGVLV